VELLTHLEIVALLISAICHDFEHPGLNNTFLANTSDSLALRYNDKSILENHHCARHALIPSWFLFAAMMMMMMHLIDAFRAFLLMRKPETAILTGLSEIEYRELRKIVVNCILATDMLKHVESLTRHLPPDVIHRVLPDCIGGHALRNCIV